MALLSLESQDMAVLQHGSTGKWQFLMTVQGQGMVSSTVGDDNYPTGTWNHWASTCTARAPRTVLPQKKRGGGGCG